MTNLPENPTFVECTVRDILGEPDEHGRWCCFACGSRTLRLNPRREQCEQKLKCSTCHLTTVNPRSHCADVIDLVGRRDGLPFVEARDRVDALHAEWEAGRSLHRGAENKNPKDAAPTTPRSGRRAS
ncbi:MAG: hypothetical protein K2V38_14190 [Gemmataceae bacterium]|nr:hypothetical protein [Gemmataceae bacterium]